jgi:MoaA/NifB/PqqE/SkfB family radical SAM enzyme
MTTPMPEFVDSIVGGSHDLQLDGTKIGWYKERVLAYMRGEKIAPITMDVALTRRCQSACRFCYASLQSSDGGGEITKQQAFEFFEDAAEIGVRGISLISDGESTNVPYYVEAIEYAASLGLQLGISSNGILLTPNVLEKIMPSLSYLRFNFSGGERKRYAEIMGMKQVWFDKIQDHIRAAMEIKRRDKLATNVNIQFVVAPVDADQILPFARLAKKIGNSVPDNGGFYGIMKHCADSADNALGVDYKQYSDLFPLFEEAEAMSDENCKIVVKWSRIQDEGKRHYTRCMGPPFILQMSGSGLIAPCGQKFNNKYAKFHIGHIQTQRFRDIFKSDRYWDVLGYLSGGMFRPDLECGENCLQQNSNQWLSDYVDGKVDFPSSPPPPHLGFL